MRADDLVEVICATHLSSYVEGPYKERGGLMIVGAPGTLKSSLVDVLDQQYADALVMSDLNSQSLVSMRDAIAAGRIRTLVFPEYAKLHQRHPYTAANVEGTIAALVGEGFQAAGFEDQRVNRLRARASVIGAMTPAMRDRKFSEWEESGFNRRFLWALFRLSDPSALERAAVEWRRVEFQVAHVPRPPEGGFIPNLTTIAQRRELQRLIKYQPGGSAVLQLQLLIRILAVLRWWYGQIGATRDPMDVMRAFGHALGREGAEIELRSPERNERPGDESRQPRRHGLRKK